MYPIQISPPKYCVRTMFLVTIARPTIFSYSSVVEYGTCQALV